MTMSNGDLDSLEAANAQAKAILEAGMGTGYHSFTRRLKDFVDPVGNETGLDCLLFGHTWYVDGLKGTGMFRCFCDECGAGSDFQEIPTEAYDFVYGCWECDKVMEADKIIPHKEEEHGSDPYDPGIKPFFDLIE